jgi:hypothetical protein
MLHVTSKQILVGPNQTPLFFVLMRVNIQFLRCALSEFRPPFMEAFFLSSFLLHQPAQQLNLMSSMLLSKYRFLNIRICLSITTVFN